MSDPRKSVFDAVREICPNGVFNEPHNIQALNNLLDAFGAKREDNVTPRVMSDKDKFFLMVRGTTGPLSQVQVDTIEGLLKSATHWSPGFLAYGLATAWGECRLEPIDEIGKGKGRPYGAPGKYKQVPYGRGLVQLTWDANYEWADKHAAAAGLTKPGAILTDFNLVKRPDIAAFILVRGMETGAFTGRKLGDYIGESGTKGQFYEARRIINRLDKADLFASYALKFQVAILAGGWK